jgi:hypothetical protein
MRLAVSAVAIALVGCGTPSQPAATTVTNTVTVTYTPPAPPGPKTTIDTDGKSTTGRTNPDFGQGARRSLPNLPTMAPWLDFEK